MRSSREASVSTCTQPSNDLPLVSTRSLYTCEMSDQECLIKSDEELPSDYEEPVPFVDESDDSDEELCLWERILKSIVNRKSSLLNLSPSKSLSVDYRPGEDTPHSPVNSEDGLLQECSSPEVGSEIVSEDGLLQRCNTPPSPSMLSDLFGRSNPPSPLPPNPPSPLPSPHMSDDEEDVLMLSSIFGESDPPSPRISGFGSSESNPPSPIGNRPESPEPVIVNGYPIFMGQRQPSFLSSDRDHDEFAEFVIIDSDRIEDETIEE